MKVKTTLFLSILLMGIVLFSPQAFAYTAWSQPPDWFAGWDVLSNYDELSGGVIVADDFQSLDGNPITDIHWWGSYVSRADSTEPLGTPSPATNFWIGFWTDVSAKDPNNQFGYSHPGTFLKGYDFNDLIGSNDGYQDREHHNGYKYSVDVSSDPLSQQEDEIYWISILAFGPFTPGQYNPEAEWGWKRSFGIWNDNPVRVTHLGANLPEPQYGDNWLNIFPSYYMEWLSADQAFELTSTNQVIPEPASLSLLGLGLLGLVGFRKKLS